MRSVKARRRASIVLLENLPEHLARLDHPTNPERIFCAEGWKEMLSTPDPSCACPICGARFTP